MELGISSLGDIIDFGFNNKWKNDADYSLIAQKMAKIEK